MNLKIAGYAYSDHPKERKGSIPIRVSDFALDKMIETPFTAEFIDILLEEEVEDFSEYASYVEVFGQLFEVIKVSEKLQDKIYRVGIKLDSRSMLFSSKLEAFYDKKHNRVEMVYPYPHEMLNPAAYRTKGVRKRLLLLQRQDKSRFFTLKEDPPDDLRDEEEVEILINWDPAAVEFKKTS